MKITAEHANFRFEEYDVLSEVSELFFRHASVYIETVAILIEDQLYYITVVSKVSDQAEIVTLLECTENKRSFLVEIEHYECRTNLELVALHNTFNEKYMTVVSI